MCDAFIQSGSIAATDTDIFSVSLQNLSKERHRNFVFSNTTKPYIKIKKNVTRNVVYMW